jgi:putative ABC transport system permease protein
MAGIFPLVRQNLRRNLRHNLLSAIGVVVGVASLVFFLALDAGVRKVVLGQIFPVDRLEAVAPRATLFGGAKRIDQALVQKLREPGAGAPSPAAVYPKMKLAVPARGWGGKRLMGRDLHFEVGGFCVGIDARMLATEAIAPYRFEDHGMSDARAPRCGAGATACPSGRYCAADVGRCLLPVPALISKHMIEIYNGSIASSHPRMPRIPSFVTSVFAGRHFSVEIGRGYFGATAARGGTPIVRRFRLVGVSDKAEPLGLTIPLAYVKRWNKRFAGKGRARHYSSVALRVRSKADITQLSAYVRSLGLDLAKNQGETIGVFITLATLLLSLISGIIVIVAAINVAHTFMMLVAERRREIGVLRAVGATRGQVRRLLLAEAGVVGLVSGLVGVLLATVAAWGADWYSATKVADFPFKPSTYFVFSPGLLAIGVGFALICCLLGAAIPAGRAARLDPAEAIAPR